jgi:hypothetical protein
VQSCKCQNASGASQYNHECESSVNVFVSVDVSRDDGHVKGRWASGYH